MPQSILIHSVAVVLATWAITTGTTSPLYLVAMFYGGVLLRRLR